MANDASADATPVLTRLVLIRHGESVGNATQAIHGPRMCGGLSDTGREQCELLAERLARTGELAGSVLFASQFRRAQETAKLIAPSLGDPEIVVDDGFGEIDWGVECDGLTFTEIVERFGTPTWDGDPEVPFIPGGESWAVMKRRVKAAVDGAIATHPGRTVAIATHGGVVESAMRHALGVDGRGQFDLWTTNTSLTTITHVSAAAGPGRWRIERYNDAAHLS